jgi:hypothetical protein
MQPENNSGLDGIKELSTSLKELASALREAKTMKVSMEHAFSLPRPDNGTLLAGGVILLAIVAAWFFKRK